ncbi:MAG: division/cell wall cluster transcriptional repressor MraZ [Chitinispirillia bacterium]|nr:division/cell wall cluster transcriptional repressor MraZ [Chitinispirillia bacterium]MCL2267809.1 division/cell wall cluster transcriptional repressor MraZ [Chitinispirillia bacterium]
MATFRGNYGSQLDAKGRVNIPAKFRKALSPEAEETFIVVCAPEGCLRAYPKDVWDKFESKLVALPESIKNNWFKETIFSSLTEATLDVQGRIMLAPDLIKDAGITKEVKLVGNISHIKLWDGAKHEEYLASGGKGDPTPFAEAFYAVGAELGGL